MSLAEIEYSERKRRAAVPDCLNEVSLFNQHVSNAYKEANEFTKVVGKSNPKRKSTTTNNSRDSQRDSQQSWSEYEQYLNIVNTPPVTYLRPSGRNVDWDKFIALENPQILNNLSVILPVESFKGVPFENIWKDIAKVGLYIELRNPFAMVRDDVYWIASTIHFAGYKALVKFENFSNDENQLNYVSWISFCSGVPKPLGWCHKNKKTLEPGPIVSRNMQRRKLEKRLSTFYSASHGTISSDHVRTLKKELFTMRTLEHSMPIECLDVKHSLDQNRLARVCTIVGDRVYVQFYNDQGYVDDSMGYWFSYKSESIHPFGWSHSVGVKLMGNPNDIRSIPLPSNFFPSWPSDKIEINKGMRLEVRNPIVPSRIVGAIIMKVLKYGYFIVQTRDIDCRRRVSALFHVTSPFIKQVGFGSKHNIQVEYVESKSYYLGNSRLSLQLSQLPPRPPHSFTIGKRLEMVDPLDPRFAGPATIKKVADNLLYTHCDHWNPAVESNYFWLDSEGSEIYPAGYSEMVGLEYQSSA